VLWHAAKGGNWPLAHYQFRQMRHFLQYVTDYERRVVPLSNRFQF
jgi:hypothetical protein